MSSDMINISKTELHNLVREYVKEELEKFGLISDSEEEELNALYGSSLYDEDYNKDNSIRL